MFDPGTYQRRRSRLADAVGEGVVLLPAALPAARNYADETHPYRQSSHLLYYAGLGMPELVLVIHAGDGRAVLYGRPVTIDDVIWCGPLPSLEERAARAGIDEVAPLSRLGADLAAAAGAGQPIHYLPPFRASAAEQLGGWLGRPIDEVRAGVSASLIRAVAEQRLVKEPDEVAQIEEALGVTARMYAAVAREVRAGLIEADIAGLIQGIALRAGRQQSFQPITSIHGEVLHNDSRHQVLRDGQLLVVDSGAESAFGYASDITRTFPVSGRFDGRQRAIYEVVLAAQRAGIEAIAPGVPYRDVHLRSARTIAEGLIEVGLMTGDADDAVAEGAHALFFPHGLGHALGLDTHDMEDLGDVVGYEAGEGRDGQFGLNFLRFARALREGYVVTVEPGIYFVPALIDRWRGAGRCATFVDFAALDAYRDFGGIRIEDDVLVTASGSRVLGPPIPKGVGELEAAMAAD